MVKPSGKVDHVFITQMGCFLFDISDTHVCTVLRLVVKIKLIYRRSGNASLQSQKGVVPYIYIFLKDGNRGQGSAVGRSIKVGTSVALRAREVKRWEGLEVAY